MFYYCAVHLSKQSRGDGEGDGEGDGDGVGAGNISSILLDYTCIGRQSEHRRLEDLPLSVMVLTA